MSDLFSGSLTFVRQEILYSECGRLDKTCEIRLVLVIGNVFPGLYIFQELVLKKSSSPDQDEQHNEL